MPDTSTQLPTVSIWTLNMFSKSKCPAPTFLCFLQIFSSQLSSPFQFMAIPSFQLVRSETLNASSSIPPSVSQVPCFPPPTPSAPTVISTATTLAGGISWITTALPFPLPLFVEVFPTQNDHSFVWKSNHSSVLHLWLSISK